ncbi:hypothetical protein DL771_002655 [Monosporascus sp. 5C6A]|nr:hypothetical protein DL771_002655 [Monosporascus sp. 5C6A]
MSDRASTSLKETEVRAGQWEGDSLNGVGLEPSSNLARFVECVVLGRDDFVIGSFSLGQDLGLNNFIVTEINCVTRGLA